VGDDDVMLSLARTARLETRVGQGFCCCAREGDDRDVNVR